MDLYLCTVASRWANNLERRISEIRESVGEVIQMDSQSGPRCENICEPHNCPQEGIHFNNQVYKRSVLWMSASTWSPSGSSVVLCKKGMRANVGSTTWTSTCQG